MSQPNSPSIFDLHDEPTLQDRPAYTDGGPVPSAPRRKSGLAPRGPRRLETIHPAPMGLPSVPGASSAHLPRIMIEKSVPVIVEEATKPGPEVESAAPAPSPARSRFGFLGFDAMTLNKLVVSSYKVMGFAILALILSGLGTFIFVNLFYLVNTSWATPLMLSSTDPRVLQVTGQRASLLAGRESLAIQRLDLMAKRDDAERIAASESDFQKSFAATLSSDQSVRESQLAMFKQLLTDVRQTRGQVVTSNRDFSELSQKALKQEYAAHLIDKDQHVRGGYELSQIAGANVGLHERHVEIDTRVADLTREVESLDAARGNSQGVMSYEVLHMQHELEQSVLAAKKAVGDENALSASIETLGREIDGYDVQLARIEKAPYLLAADRSIATAFVPYDNIGAAHVGDKVYACAVGVFGCHAAGTVAEILDGEIIGNHPLHNRELRGVLVRLDLVDAAAIAKPVLHLERKPLGI